MPIGSGHPEVRLHPASGYLLKEGLRVVFQLSHDAAAQVLEWWISWAGRCRISALVKLQKCTVTQRRRILTRIAFGFRSAEALVAMAMLTLSGHRPALPGRG